VTLTRRSADIKRKKQVTYGLDRNHLLYKYQFITGKINIIKGKKRNVCLSHDHHPLNICISTIESIDIDYFLLKQAHLQSVNPICIVNTRCVKNMMMSIMMRKFVFFQTEQKKGYNVDFSDLHIINIYNEENKY